jgi:ribosome-associated toxin RatA of RatAB toxin-antitoxin module
MFQVKGAKMAEAEHREVLDVSLEDLYNTILDFESYPRFASGVKSSRINSREGDALIVGMELEMVKRIDYVISVKHTKDAENKQAQVEWSLHSGSLFKKNNGRWLLKSLGNSKTEVIYKLEVDFNFTVPGFILKGLVQKSLPGAVKDFYEETRRRKK